MKNWPPTDKLKDGAKYALKNASSWLSDAENLAKGRGTPGHVVALAIYAEEEAAKAYLWLNASLLFLIPAFRSMLPQMQSELDKHMGDHAFRQYVVWILENTQVMPNAVAFFGNPLTDVDWAQNDPGEKSIDEWMETMFSDPVYQPLAAMMEMIVRNTLSPNLDGEEAEAMIKHMRRERNRAIYVDWGTEHRSFSTPQTMSVEGMHEKLQAASGVVKVVDGFLGMMDRLEEALVNMAAANVQLQDPGVE